jgi:hypothetical protein
VDSVAAAAVADSAAAVAAGRVAAVAAADAGRAVVVAAADGASLAGKFLEYCDCGRPLSVVAARKAYRSRD